MSESDKTAAGTPPRGVGADSELVRAAAPVQLDRGQAPDELLTDGIGLCLSGGGYRAMLFHTGALWRLNELGYLQRLDRISSVSGGSITAGVLASRWNQLAFDQDGVATNYKEVVVAPLRGLAGKTIDVWSILRGILTARSIGGAIARAYRRHLFGNTTLTDLPNEPRFIFNATNLQSGVLWRFSKPYMRDYMVGEVRLAAAAPDPSPQIPLASAVAASSAFPPFLSPLVLRLKTSDFTPNSGTPTDSGENIEHPPFTTRVVLSDGGVYDNLGLETVWKRYRTILVSDGGGHLSPAERPRGFWPLQVLRVLSVIDSQVRALRKRQTIDGYKAGIRKGTYWGIRTNIADYQLPSAMNCPHAKTLALANIATRLGGLETTIQERLINWGYAVCDAAIRTHVDQQAPPPNSFPYDPAGVG
jgi:NTE family protein